jgi:hypothetical protein
MSISLVGLTLHVAGVERSLNFYKRLPDSSGLARDGRRFHKFECN